MTAIIYPANQVLGGINRIHHVNQSVGWLFNQSASPKLICELLLPTFEIFMLTPYTDVLFDFYGT